jgi:hypothetical protein
MTLLGLHAGSIKMIIVSMFIKTHIARCSWYGSELELIRVLSLGNHSELAYAFGSDWSNFSSFLVLMLALVLLVLTLIILHLFIHSQDFLGLLIFLFLLLCQYLGEYS